jgi:hypothetical protein
MFLTALISCRFGLRHGLHGNPVHRHYQFFGLLLHARLY